MTSSLRAVCACAVMLAALPVAGQVSIEKVAYFNQPNCYRLSNGTVEAIVTTNIGPRVIRYGFIGGENVFAEIPETVVKTDLGDWHPWGGHRLWTAPEGMPRSYSPDNTPIQYKILAPNMIDLIQPVEPRTGIQKEMIVRMDVTGTGVMVRHRITNRNLWAIDAAPWAMSIMNGGGVTILPQEPYMSHDEYLQPARPMVLWHYTNLSDPRWTLGRKYLRLRTAETMKESQKIGILNKQGWAAYLRKGVLFIKRFPFVEGRAYPDYNCNNETYTSATFMEVETLGPLAHIDPYGAVDHIERWHLFRNVTIGRTEDSLDRAIAPLVAQTLEAPPAQRRR